MVSGTGGLSSGSGAAPSPSSRCGPAFHTARPANGALASAISIPVRPPTANTPANSVPSAAQPTTVDAVRWRVTSRLACLELATTKPVQYGVRTTHRIPTTVTSRASAGTRAGPGALPATGVRAYRLTLSHSADACHFHSRVWYATVAYLIVRACTAFTSGPWLRRTQR